MTIQKERFTQDNDYVLLKQIIQMIQKSDFDLPPYEADTRKRDDALQSLWRSESLLSGVLSSAVSRDKNRGWILTGPVRQVNRFSKRLHSVNNGIGWRDFVSLNSTQWYTSNFGYLSEIEFEVKDGPALSMYNMDTTQTRRTGNAKYPIAYYKNNKTFSVEKNAIPMKYGEYVSANSLPSPQEKLRYAGFCALERAMIFTRIAIGLNQHHLDKLGMTIPKGILHMSGITRTEFKQALEQYKADKLNVGTGTYDGVMGFFTKDPNSRINLLNLSQLPDNFSLKQFVDILMQAYALAFEYPVGEFWAIETGSFGRTGEMNIQQQQAYAKGEMDFSLSFQEQIQQFFLPPSLWFSFESRNDAGYSLKAEINKQKTDLILDVFERGMKYASPIISSEQVLGYLADEGIIPKSWSKLVDEEEETTDLQETRDRLLSNPSFLKYYQYSDEPIVKYEYNTKNIPDFFDYRKQDALIGNNLNWGQGKVRVLYRNYEELRNARRYF